MNRVQRWSRLSLSLTMVLSFAHPGVYAAPTPATKAVPKPVQLVLLAFDGSEDAIRWQQTTDFAKEVPVKFTYFASGVMFLGRIKKPGNPGDTGVLPYHGPQHNAGYSDIGFSAYQSGNTLTNQPLISDPENGRVHWMNTAIEQGHEIGSHLNGHFASHPWTAQNWKQEFDDFWELLFDVEGYRGSLHQLPAPFNRKSFLNATMKYTNPNVTPYNPTGSEDAKNAIVGFRAPLLAQNPAMYPVLVQEGFLYDTSRTAQQNYWPQKMVSNGHSYWNFPLAEINLKGCTGGSQGHIVFDVSKFTKNDQGQYPDENIYVDPAKQSFDASTMVRYEEQCDTLTMDYNLLVAQAPAAQRGAPKMLTDERQLKMYENQVVDTYREYFRSNYMGNRAPVNIGHHFALWNNGIYWNAMQRLAREVCVLSDVRCIKYKDLMAYMNGLSADELAAYKAGNFTKEMELEPKKFSKNDNKNYRAVSSETLDPKNCSHWGDVCNEEQALEDAAKKAANGVTSALENAKRRFQRIQHLRLPYLEARARKDWDTIQNDPTYKWLVKEGAQGVTLATETLDNVYNEAKLKLVHPQSHALNCEGGAADCVAQINEKVEADHGQPYHEKQ